MTSCQKPYSLAIVRIDESLLYRNRPYGFSATDFSSIHQLIVASSGPGIALEILDPSEHPFCLFRGTV